jgi:hypothetical protein
MFYHGSIPPPPTPEQNYRTPSNLPKGKAKLISQQTDKISQQPENCNGPDLVQAFPKKWWVDSATQKYIPSKAS